jgi:hypothetical protein
MTMLRGKTCSTNWVASSPFARSGVRLTEWPDALVANGKWGWSSVF